MSSINNKSNCTNYVIDLTKSDSSDNNPMNDSEIEKPSSGEKDILNENNDVFYGLGDDAWPSHLDEIPTLFSDIEYEDVDYDKLISLGYAYYPNYTADILSPKQNNDKREQIDNKKESSPGLNSQQPNVIPGMEIYIYNKKKMNKDKMFLMSLLSRDPLFRYDEIEQGYYFFFDTIKCFSVRDMLDDISHAIEKEVIKVNSPYYYMLKQNHTIQIYKHNKKVYIKQYLMKK